jgi:polyhydroxyalkanoate synthase
MSQFKIPVDLIMSKLAEASEKAQQKVYKGPEVLLEDLDTRIAATPYEVVYSEDRVKLKYYRPKGKPKYKTPLLVVYALINRETMLDLQPGRSVVETLLAEGLEVYMIDWGYPKRKDRFLGFDDHINGYMDNVVDFIRDRHRLTKINLMGICMGGTFSVIYSAQHPDKIKNLVTTVTPTYFDTDKGLLHQWMRSIDPDALINTYGNLPGDVMNLGFLLLNPARLMIDKYVGFMEHMDNKNFVENFIRMEKWIFDSPDLPGAVFSKFIRDCYQRNLLIQNKLRVGGRRVDLKKLSMPLLNIYGQYDHLVPPEACERLTQAVASTDTEDICLRTGHIGIYVSSKCQREFAPKIAAWLAARDTQRRRPKKAPVKRASAPKKQASAPKKQASAPKKQASAPKKKASASQKLASALKEPDPARAKANADALT